MEIPYEDENGDPIMPHDLPGYVGMIFDGEMDLSSALGDLGKFPWDEYYMLADELQMAERKLSLPLKTKTYKIESEAWYPEAFIGGLPSVVAVYDCPPDQGPAGGSGYVFFKVDGYSDQDVLNEANELYKALRSDYELLEAEQERREQESD
jgi:hypothetical protein